MSDDVLILSTHWKDGYWETNNTKEARYPGIKYTEMDNFSEVAEKCPLAGIGKYHTRLKREPFRYLKIIEMSFNPSNSEPVFRFSSFSTSSSSSNELDEYLSGRYFYTEQEETILEALSRLEEEPPTQWLDLLNQSL